MIVRDLVKAQEICSLVAKGAIMSVKTLMNPGEFYSEYVFVLEKTWGLGPLNIYLKVIPFHMLITREVLQAILPGNCFTSIDLTEAYFHVPIAPPQWRCYIPKAV